MMKNKKSRIGTGAPTWLVTVRQLASRNASKYAAGGREKRQTRPVPSLPKLKCLEKFEKEI